MLEFRKEDSALLLLYMPDLAGDDVRKKLDQDNLHLKHTFHLCRKNEYVPKTAEPYEYEFCFKVGELVGKYYLLDRDVFGTDHNFYFSAGIDFKSYYFVAHQNRAILPKIDRLVSEDVFITDSNEIIPGHIPFREFKALVSTFPNSTELKKYTDARISQVLSNYLDGLGNVTESYERYLDKHTALVPTSPIDSDPDSLKIFQNAYYKIKFMLENVDAYAERDWQLEVCRIICILYPKYILAKREQCIGTDGRHKKIPDFLLVDAAGFVDLLEIKKPNQQRLLTTTKYRNNYVADRDLSGAIVQVEKYIYTLNHGGSSIEASLQRDLGAKLPEGVSIHITNPQGMLLMGRSNTLSIEQQLDLEIIKRQHKNLVDIMTYDDLLERLRNILTQIESSSIIDL